VAGLGSAVEVTVGWMGVVSDSAVGLAEEQDVPGLGMANLEGTLEIVQSQSRSQIDAPNGGIPLSSACPHLLLDLALDRENLIEDS